jgi:hypothetical protein
MTTQPPPSSAPINATRAALLILMTLAMVGALVAVALRFAPAGRWLFALPICLMVALEGYLTTLWLRQPERRHLSHFQYRAAEWVVLFFGLRLATWAIQSNWPQPALWVSYLSNPLLLVNDLYFFIILLLAALTWHRIVSTAKVFIQLSPDSAERAYYALPRPERLEANQPLATNREALLAEFRGQFLIGAIGMLFCTMLVTVDSETLRLASNPLTAGINRLNLPPLLLTSLLLYFFSGYFLLSQGRLAMLEARWLTQDVAQASDVVGQWQRRSLLLLLVISLVAALLPIGSTLPFARLLNYLLYLASSLISSLVYLISLLVYNLLRWFLPDEPMPEPEPIEPEAALPPLEAPPPPLETESLLQMITTSAFWAVVIVLGTTAVLFFLRERGMPLNRVGLRRLGAVVGQWWRELWQSIAGQAEELRQAVLERLQTRAKTEDHAPRPRFIRLNALPPQEKVRYFYLSTVQRATRQGVPRQESETPSEYAADLKENWPEAETAVDELTEAFIHARYRRQPITEEDIPPIKAHWQRLKASLRRRIDN